MSSAKAAEIGDKELARNGVHFNAHCNGIRHIGDGSRRYGWHDGVTALQMLSNYGGGKSLESHTFCE